ncbi:MAG: hypothetical protein HFH49_11470 [Lachnospiraceae bacterium]|nr:hypothetical protein [Lachnospiraceae bacterium]
MALKVDEYLSSCGVVAELLKRQTVSGTNSTEETDKTDEDSYISTVGNSKEAVPCENYNNILQVIQTAKAEAGQSGTSSEKTEQSETVSGAESSEGNSESGEETTTEIVVINGVTYLQTTTVVDGISSVQRTVIGGQRGEDEASYTSEKATEQKITDK